VFPQYQPNAGILCDGPANARQVACRSQTDRVLCQWFFASKRNGKNRKRSEKVDEEKESEKCVVFILLSVEPKKFVRKAKNVNYISFRSEMEQYEAKYKVSKVTQCEKNAIFISLLGEAKNLMQKEVQKHFFAATSETHAKRISFHFDAKISKEKLGHPISAL
jgi:hypothetical protein